MTTQTAVIIGAALVIVAILFRNGLPNIDLSKLGEWLKSRVPAPKPVQQYRSDAEALGVVVKYEAPVPGPAQGTLATYLEGLWSEQERINSEVAALRAFLGKIDGAKTEIPS